MRAGSVERSTTELDSKSLAGSNGSARPMLTVDDRQDDKFTRALEEHFDVHVKHLTTGDLVFTSPLGLVGIEDKCTSDLESSRNNGRLDDELRRLQETYAVPILLWRQDPGHWIAGSYENLMLGRQFYGVFTYRVSGVDSLAAQGVFGLYEYMQRKGPGMDGIRRERLREYHGPLSGRAEIIYNVLGLAAGIRNRRAVADQIASTTTVSSFMHWTQTDFTAAGFSAHMARKLATILNQMEGYELGNN